MEELVLKDFIRKSWNKIAPFWPIENLISVNPLQGFEENSFEDALIENERYFNRKDIPKDLLIINQITIKWLQVFFDEKQSVIGMPLKEQGFLKAILKLLVFDGTAHLNKDENRAFIRKLRPEPIEIISLCLREMSVELEQIEVFCTLLLTTLPGWASFISYKSFWEKSKSNHFILNEEYLAFRILLFYLISKSPASLISWHQKEIEFTKSKEQFEKIQNNETAYQKNLFNLLQNQTSSNQKKSKAQFIFCIDVRSEPMRKAIENLGDYETFGVAGFFSLPIEVHSKCTQNSFASCPVLLKPDFSINLKEKKKRKFIQLFRKFYSSTKYSIISPFALAESTGFFWGLFLVVKSFFPALSQYFSRKCMESTIEQRVDLESISTIPFDKRVDFAYNLLNGIGLVKDFAPIIVFCGHGGQTLNNPFRTALDCGACGGRPGGINAQTIASILNDQKIRQLLKIKGIKIPEETVFVGAFHNTTTDHIHLFDENCNQKSRLDLIKKDLAKAADINRSTRIKNLGYSKKEHPFFRAGDWSQPRPEWGLAKNGSLIVAPRALSRDVDLGGRSFLHSYDYTLDEDASVLSSILSAPGLVAFWINSQYLFSTLNNVIHGAGSKITKNIIGKFAIVQGNDSDIMNGLPLQSVYKTDVEPYHESMRLSIIIYAPLEHIQKALDGTLKIKSLCLKEWIHLFHWDPQTKLINKFTVC